MNNEFEESMLTVRRNLEVLCVCLQNSGYQFSNPDKALLGPDPEVENKLITIETKVGKVPEALATFYRVVGSVDFTGSHVHWTGCEYPDPIVVDPLAATVEELEHYLCDEQDYIQSYGSFRIPIAPDYYHKEDVSGGMWYGIAVPNESDDPELLEEWHHTTFTGYLKVCLAWAGFPGLECAQAHHTWPIAELRKGLVAF